MINTNVFNKILIGIENIEIVLQLKELKKIVELSSYKILPNKLDGKVQIDKIFYDDYVVCFLTAIIFNSTNISEFEKYTSQIKILNIELNNSDYKKILLADIYMYVIKNKIMVI